MLFYLLSTAFSCERSFLDSSALLGANNWNITHNEPHVFLGDEAIFIEIKSGNLLLKLSYLHIKRKFHFCLQIRVVNLEKAMYELPEVNVLCFAQV